MLSSGALGAGPVDEVRHGGAVDVGQALLLRRVVDEEESVGLLVRPVRGVHRDLHALLDDLVLHRTLEVEALAHRRRGLEQQVGIGDDERSLEEGLPCLERAPVLPDAIDQSVLGEVVEESVDVLVGPAPHGGGPVGVLTEHEGTVDDGADVVEAQRGQVVAVDPAAVGLRRRRGPAQHLGADLVLAPEHGLARGPGELPQPVPPLDVVAHQRQTVELPRSLEELLDGVQLLLTRGHVIPLGALASRALFRRWSDRTAHRFRSERASVGADALRWCVRQVMAPPLTPYTWPVIQSAPSDARKAHMAPMSVPVPLRGIG